MDAATLQQALDDIFDQASHPTRLPAVSVRHCVQADVETAVGAEAWRRSLDDRLIDYITPVFSDLEVTNLPLGYTPFVVRDDAGDRGA